MTRSRRILSLVHCGGERPRVAKGRGHGCVTCAVAPRQTRNMSRRRSAQIGDAKSDPKSRSLCQSLSRLEDHELILCIVSRSRTARHQPHHLAVVATTTARCRAGADDAGCSPWPCSGHTDGGALRAAARYVRIRCVAAPEIFDRSCVCRLDGELCFPEMRSLRLRLLDAPERATHAQLAELLWCSCVQVLGAGDAFGTSWERYSAP